MTDRIHMDREGGLFRIDIDAHLEHAKAAEIVRLVEEDAGDGVVKLGDRRRLRRLSATGLVTPPTMRRILEVLAA